MGIYLRSNLNNFRFCELRILGWRRFLKHLWALYCNVDILCTVRRSNIHPQADLDLMADVHFDLFFASDSNQCQEMPQWWLWYKDTRPQSCRIQVRSLSDCSCRKSGVQLIIIVMADKWFSAKSQHLVLHSCSTFTILGHSWWTVWSSRNPYAGLLASVQNCINTFICFTTD